MKTSNAALATGEVVAPEPGVWPLVPLRDLCQPHTGTRRPADRPEELFRYVDISGVDNQQKRVTQAHELRGRDAPSRARNVIRARDVIVATTRPNLNAVALVPADLDNQICSTGFCVLRAGPRILPEYLFAFVCSGSFIDPLTELVKGALYPAVNDAQVLALEIPLPPLAEQQRIAARLTEQLAAVSGARAAALARLAAAEALPVAYLREVFDGLKESVLSRPLGEISEIASGVTLGKRAHAANGRAVPYLRVANVQDGRLMLDDVYTIRATEEEIEELALRRGDLVLTEGGDRDKLGRGTWWNDEFPLCLHQNHIFRVRLHGEVTEHEFFGLQLRSSYVKDYFLAHAKQTTGIATINRHVLSSLPVLLPEPDDQRRIAAHLSRRLAAAERLAASVSAELAAVEALPAALLREAFGGNRSSGG